MPSMVKLWYSTRWQTLASGARCKLVRLHASVVFRTREGGETRAYTAVVDTGAPITMLPRWLWEKLDVTIHDKRVYLGGVHPGKR